MVGALRARSKVVCDEAGEVAKTQTVWISLDKSCFKHGDMIRTGWKNCSSCNVENGVRMTLE